jgi:DNA uptake protein ComE-like DNA-binding protein
LVLFLGCGDIGDPSPPSTQKPGSAGKADNMQTRKPISFETFVDQAQCLDGEDICIVNGDVAVPLGKKGLKAYYETQIDTRDGALTAHDFGTSLNQKLGQVSGEETRFLDINRWSRSRRFDLTYCVSEKFKSFTDDVTRSMAMATNAWEAHAHVEFKHVWDLNGACKPSNPDVFFAVVPNSKQGNFGSAFNPGYPEPYKKLRLNISNIQAVKNAESEEFAQLSLTGIIRHELGHILGFEHEHVRLGLDKKTCSDNGYKDVTITEYDKKSVMHYPFCEGADWSLELSTLDQQGARFYYPNFEAYPGGRCDTELNENGEINPGCEPVVRQILELATRASKSKLANRVGLDTRAAKQIVETRRQDPITTLSDLRDTEYLRKSEIRKMYNYLYRRGRCETEFLHDGKPNPSCRPLVNRVVYFANNASKSTLDDEASIDSRAASNIVSQRQDAEFRDLSELWEVSYVKTRATRKMWSYLTENNETGVQ